MTTLHGLEVAENCFETARGERCILEECRGACCANGIWVDVAHVQRILAHAEQIRPFMAPEYRDQTDLWFNDEEVMEHTDFPSGLGIATTVGPRPGNPAFTESDGRDGCVFLRNDHKCSLHVASETLGLGYPGLKPFDCATYPVLRSEGELLMDDKSPGELGGADCQRPTRGERQPRYVVFREEIELSIGRAGWQELAAVARKR